MRWKKNFWIMVSTAMIFVLTVSAVMVAPADAASGPKNVIILIGDGMGYNQTLTARLFRWGKGAAQVYASFPTRLAMSTYPAFEEGEACFEQGYNPEQAWGDFNYVRDCATDSAAAATAMATGVKTENGLVGEDIYYNDLRTIMDMAEELGKSTGVVTSVQFSHATPAGFTAHGNRANFRGIAYQMIYESNLEVVMGAGHPFFDNNGNRRESALSFDYVGGESAWNDLVAGIAGADADADGEADPWTLIETREAFKKMMSGKTPERVIGVAPVHTTLAAARSGDSHAGPNVIPINPEVPTLAEMTRAALNVLDNNRKGFFLMVEGGAIDWAASQNKVGRMVEEQIAFDKTVEYVVKWVGSHGGWSRNLVIVAGDHETGYLLGAGSDPTWNKIVSKGKNRLPDTQWYSESHTNSLVGFYAKGKNAGLFFKQVVGIDPVRKRYIDNTAIARVIFQMYGQ